MHRLFRKFYADYDSDENFVFDFQEMVDCFEGMSSEDMLGKRGMKKTLKSIGANFTGGIMALFKEGHYNN